MLIEITFPVQKVSSLLPIQNINMISFNIVIRLGKFHFEHVGDTKGIKKSIKGP